MSGTSNDAFLDVDDEISTLPTSVTGTVESLEDLKRTLSQAEGLLTSLQNNRAQILGDVARACGAGARSTENSLLAAQGVVPVLRDRRTDGERAESDRRFADVDAKIEIASRGVAEAKARLASFDSITAELLKLGKPGEIILSRFAEISARFAALEQRIAANP